MHHGSSSSSVQKPTKPTNQPNKQNHPLSGCQLFLPTQQNNGKHQPHHTPPFPQQNNCLKKHLAIIFSALPIFLSSSFP
jgi:hypothetical protein